MSFQPPELPYRLHAYDDLLKLQPRFKEVLAAHLEAVDILPGSPEFTNTLGRTAYLLSSESPAVDLPLPTIGADSVKPTWIQYGQRAEGLLRHGIIHMEFTALKDGVPHTHESDRDVSTGGGYCALFGSAGSEILPSFYPENPNGKNDLDLNFGEIPHRKPMTDDEARLMVKLATEMLEMPLDDPSWLIVY